MSNAKALGAAYFKNVITGFICISLGFLFLGRDESIEHLFFGFIFLTALNFFVSLVYVIAFLLPISILDKKRIEKYEVMDLFKRYLPILVFPLFGLCSVMCFVSNHKANTDNEYAVFFFIPTLVLIQTASGLWTFLKKLKA
ncbi:MAG TPA: hypothetical protein VFF27_04755 [Bacteroidia bacterium]|jgi:hypothetical protein|nr:hypothetical protein [Bacteroidia bacterium]